MFMKCRGANQTPRGDDGADHGDDSELVDITTPQTGGGQRGKAEGRRRNYRSIADALQ